MRAWPTAHARIAHERARTRRCSTGPPQQKTPHNSKHTPVSSCAQHTRSAAHEKPPLTWLRAATRPRSPLCPTPAPAIDFLAALEAQRLQLHHLLHLLRLEHAGGRRRRHPRRHEQVRHPGAPAARRNATAPPAPTCHAIRR
eukprot:5939336-Prymnesium_polylepis.1